MLVFTLKRKVGCIGLLCFCLTLILINFQKDYYHQNEKLFSRQVKQVKLQQIQSVLPQEVELVKPKYTLPVLNMNATNDGKETEMEIHKKVSKNRTIWKTLPPGTQMGEQQVASIIKVLPQTGNLLVWGLGNDSPFWHDSTQGKVIFIEPKGFWYNKIKKKFPYLEAYSVNYTTETIKSFNKYINNRTIWPDLDLRSQLPTVVLQTPWDVILVDAPPGYKGAPGRYQSIYTSSLIAKNGSHVFVDDYERKVEREFSLKMLGTPVEVVRRKAKGSIGANQQAHFIYTYTKRK